MGTKYSKTQWILKMDLTNRFMNNPQYLAQVGHFLGGCLAVVLTAFFWGMTASYITLGVGLIAASAKEFWYDLKYEIPKQTFMDSFMDFGFYALGGLIGLGLACIKFYIK